MPITEEQLTQVNTELTALANWMNDCDNKVREARPILNGLRSVSADVDHDGSALDAERRVTLATSLIAKSKTARGATG